MLFFGRGAESCKAGEKPGADPDYTVVKIKMADAAGYKIDFYPATTDTYREENGYRLYRFKIPYNRTYLLVIRNPSFKVIPQEGVIPPPQLTLFLKRGAEITIEGDAKMPVLARVTSSDADVMEYEIFRAKQAQIEYRLWEATGRQVKLEAGKDTAGAAAMAQKARDILEEKSAWEREFVKEHPQSWGALEIFGLFYQHMDSGEAWAIFKNFPAAYKEAGMGKEIAGFFAALHATQPGNPVLAFKQEGIDGKPVDLDALKGRVLIIDFWGSWCGPCRRSHPHLKAVYEKYRNKGLEIIGIAQEGGTGKSRDSLWREAVREDGIPWLHVLNDPEKLDLVKAYSVTAFPTKLIIDREGKIVFRLTGSSSEALDRKLQEMFNY